MSLLRDAISTEAAIRRVEKGLEFEDAVFVAGELGISLERIAELTGIPRSTLFRRQGGRFTTAESEHIMRYARLWSVACEVFPNEAAARSWLSRAQFGLDGFVPLEYAKSEFGARAVEELMMRIHHGVLA
jgi:putative toxin-antitoxin system antitoxin component (TIGR02293 family)